LLIFPVPFVSVSSITNDTGNAISGWASYPQDGNLPYWALRFSKNVASYVSDENNAWTIVADVGFSTSVPLIIERILIDIAAWHYHKRNTGVDVERPIFYPDGTIALPPGMPKYIKDVLKSIKRQAWRGADVL